MKRLSLQQQHHETIMAHINDPENSPLPPKLRDKLDRVISVSKLLDRYPVLKNAVAVHMSKYPDISRATAFRDVQLARKVYNSFHKFDYDFYHTWLINDILEHIRHCKSVKSPYYDKIVAMQHANLQKVLGPPPEEIPDPNRNEKHNFFLMVNIDNRQVKVDINNLHKLPEGTLRDINRALYQGKEIDELGAAEIVNT